MAYGAVGSDEERFKVLDRLHELGERNIDTADVYVRPFSESHDVSAQTHFARLQGDSEQVIGKWLKKTGHRDVFIATKFGYVKSDFSIRADPEFMHAAFKESLKNLGVDVIDLYYLHRPDPKVPIEVTVGAMAELVKCVRVGLACNCQVSQYSLNNIPGLGK